MTKPQSAFRAILGNRVVQAIAVTAALLAVTGEAVLLYTNIQKAQIERQGARNAEILKGAEATLAAQKAEVERQAANNAAMLKLAEALQKQAEAAIAAANAGNAPRRSAAETREAEAKADIAEQDAQVLKFFADCQRRGISRIDCGTTFIMENMRREEACRRSGRC